MRTGEIKALTGLRIIAAVWVVLFHFRPLLQQTAPDFNEALAPVLNCGAQGVDLFFILSGFVLTWNYLERMGPAWSLRATVHFLWLRLARVWPVYLVTLHLAAAWVIFTLHVGHNPPQDVSALNATSYVRQLLLVQLWFQPYLDASSWDGPAWSISAEWLAYVLFAGLVLVVYRMAQVTRASSLTMLAIAASLPPMMLMLVTGQFYTPWSWLPRIVMQFTAGALACAAVRRLRLTDRTRRAAGYLSAILVAAAVGVLYYFDAHPVSGIYDSGGLVDVLFVPLVMTLAVGAGSLPRLLAVKPLVYGGQISFCLYMVHELVHVGWEWAVPQFEIVLADDALGRWIVTGLLALATVMAVVLYHVVEEPARHWMRRMVEPQEKPAPIVPSEDRASIDRDPVDEILDARRDPVPASAI